MSHFGIYLIGINILGFLLLLVNIWLYTKTPTAQIDKFLTVICILGGSVGILLAILIFERKPKKGNMMSRVFVACVFVLQVILFLVLRGHISGHFTLAFWTFFGEHKWLIWYLLIINIVTFVAFAADKFAAMNHHGRIRIITLLGLAFIGGSIGALTAMYLLHHKTRKNYFTTGVPLILAMQIAILIYAMNAAW